MRYLICKQAISSYFQKVHYQADFLQKFLRRRLIPTKPKGLLIRFSFIIRVKSYKIIKTLFNTTSAAQKIFSSLLSLFYCLSQLNVKISSPYDSIFFIKVRIYGKLTLKPSGEKCLQKMSNLQEESTGDKLQPQQKKDPEQQTNTFHEVLPQTQSTEPVITEAQTTTIQQNQTQKAQNPYQEQQNNGVFTQNEPDWPAPIVETRSYEIDLDELIDRLLEVRGCKPGRQVQLGQEEILGVVRLARSAFLSENMLLQVQAPIRVCGDVHGQYYDMLRLLEYGGLPPNSRYLFLGDYVDRGRQGIQTMCLLFALKLRYPQNINLLRGNHQSASITRIYGFYEECKSRYSIRLWKAFIDCFNCMPVAALIQGKILCMHGGLSPDLITPTQILNIVRPTDVPDAGLLCDLLWADPEASVRMWGESERGVSYVFGEEIISSFLQRNDLDLICRAHQVVEDGYEFFARKQLVTLFSAPNYCGQFQNSAAMMRVDNDLRCSFQVLRPEERKNVYRNARFKTVPVIANEGQSKQANVTQPKILTQTQ